MNNRFNKLSEFIIEKKRFVSILVNNKNTRVVK